MSDHPGQVQVSCRLTEDEVDRLDDVCRRKRRSRSSMIAIWVTERLDSDDLPPEAVHLGF
jgi:hypothetical protein